MLILSSFFIFGGLFSFFFSYSWVLVELLLVFGVFLGLVSFYSFGWEGFYGFFFLDSFSCFLVILSLFIGFLMLLSSRFVLEKSVGDGVYCFFVFSLCLFLIFSFSLSNFFFFFFFFESSLIPTLLIILGWGYQPERMQAGLYMMIYTIVFSLPLLMLILHILSSSGSLFIFFDWSGLFGFSGFSSVVSLFVLVGAFFVKLPVFFLHLWLPKAHVEAPVAGSMILAGVLLKLGGYGVYRIICLSSFIGGAYSLGFIVCIMWGGVITSFICLTQSDLKALVAYSSVGHMAVLTSGFLSGNMIGSSGGFALMVGHGVCSSFLFVLASLGYDFISSRSIVLVKGLMVFFPFLSVFWFVFCVANLAAPTSLNLASELLLFMSLLGVSGFLFLFLGLMSFLVGGYSLYLFVSSNHGFSDASYGGLSSLNFYLFLSGFLHFFPLFTLFFLFDFFFI